MVKIWHSKILIVILEMRGSNEVIPEWHLLKLKKAIISSFRHSRVGGNDGLKVQSKCHSGYTPLIFVIWRAATWVNAVT